MSLITWRSLASTWTRQKAEIERVFQQPTVGSNAHSTPDRDIGADTGPNGINSEGAEATKAFNCSQ